MRIGPFLGIVSSVDAESIPDYACADSCNVRYEDGVLRPRYGWKRLAAAQAGFQTARGFDYLFGYDSSYAPVEEYASFEYDGTHCHLYSANVSTGVRSEVKAAGAVSVPLHSSLWRAFPFESAGYGYNPNDGVYKWTLGTVNTLAKLEPLAAPTTRIQWNTVAPTVQGWSALDPTVAGDIAVDGTVFVNAGSSIVGSNRRMVVGDVGDGTVEFILSAGGGPGKLDWKYRDCLKVSLVLKSGVAIDPGAFKVTLTNDDVAPKTLESTTLAYEQGVNNKRTMYTFLVWFDQGKTRADWGDGAGTGKTDKVKLHIKVTDDADGWGAYVEITSLLVGYLRMIPPNVAADAEGALEIGYTWYNSTTGYESDVGGVFEVPYTNLTGHGYGEISNFGAWLTLTTTSTLTANKVRHYVRLDDGYWRRVNEQDDGTTTYTLKKSYSEMLDCPLYEDREFELTRKVVAAGQYRGWVVWGYQGGTTNVRHSRIGNPEAQWSALDMEDDLNRGANFSLADGFDDEPLSFHQAGDWLCITGSKGVYAQIGDRPSNMSPCAKLPGSQGAANAFASARWTDDNGLPSVVWVAATGEVYAASFGQSPVAGELDHRIRGKVASFLLTGGVTYASIRVGVDASRDALWIIAGDRALVYRRRSVVDGHRHWEAVEWNLGTSTVAYIAFSSKRAMRWLRSSGEIDESEVDSSTGLFIDGATPDNGAAMPTGSIWWLSRRFPGANRRLDHTYWDLETSTDTPAITAISSRQTSTVLLEPSRVWSRFGPMQSGQLHQLKVMPLAGQDGIVRVEVQERPAGSRFNG